jgi:hypothetical protein
MLAEAHAEKGDSRALSLVNQLNKFHPVTAKAILARYYLRSGDPARALSALKTALTEFRVYPWVQLKVLYRSFELGLELVNAIPDRAMELFELYSEPFCVRIHEYSRNITLMQISAALSPIEGIKALQQLEPHVPWTEEFLRYRLQVYQKSNHSLTSLAQRELNEFVKNKGEVFFDASKDQ